MYNFLSQHDMTMVSDPDLVGSGVYSWIRIRIRFRFSNFSRSGSGFSTRILDPDPRSKVVKNYFFGGKIVNYD